MKNINIIEDSKSEDKSDKENDDISETSEEENNDSEMANNIIIGNEEESFIQFHEPDFKCNDNDITMGECNSKLDRYYW
ncbi:4495_t:CDS:2 [Funneliformis caledonium]|uniref:4495_t:CDS:1 n=1 Tax=Funneliformis caledonium TaxID=1117310 RepID=A0A9N9H316_9GLOM|nr:4495_t:CDS:2 [Funneliformis caledonium]